MNTEELFDENVNNVFSSLDQITDDIESYMSKIYQDIISIGNPSVLLEIESINTYLFCIKLCMRYYYEKEDYLKISKLNSLYDYISSPKKQIVSKELASSIVINLN